MARKRIIDLTTTATLSKNQSGSLITLGAAGGFTVTLPAPGRGLEYDFVVKTALTGETGYTIQILSAATSSMKGGVLSGAAAGNPLGQVSSGASKLEITSAAGGYVGTHLKVVCNNDGKWEVSGIAVGTGTGTIFA